MKFNKTNKSYNTIKNHEGAKAFKMCPEKELITRVLTCFLGEPKFYERADDRATAIINLAKTVNPIFLAGLAVYARVDMNLRTVPLLLASILAKRNSNSNKGSSLVRKTIDAIVQRPDQIPELLAIYAKLNGRDNKHIKPIAKQVKKGLEDAFNKFNEYQIAKYKCENNEISLKDALFLIRPKPKNNSKEVFFKLANDCLEIPTTWETKLSTNGNNKESWEELISKNSLGYMATLRNLRNILDANIDDIYLDRVINKIIDQKEIENCKQYPFRFVSAYNAIIDNANFNTKRLLNAINKAMVTSSNLLPKFEGRTIIASDISGSMNNSISSMSSITQMDIGLILSSISNKICDKSKTILFGTDAIFYNLSNDSILENVNIAKKETSRLGSGTNAHKIFDLLIEKNVFTDRIFIFSDIQFYNSNNYFGGKSDFLKKLNEYRNKVNPNVMIYNFDLSGYGTLQIPEEDKKALTIAGFSERMFEIVKMHESGEFESMIETIEAIGKTIMTRDY